MNTATYLDRLLLKYSNTFNIYKPFRIGARLYPAYGYFFSHNEKYVLVQEANMWSADSYEHIIFRIEDQITPECVKEAESLIKDEMESILVRKGEKLPAKNHMSSLLTVVLLGQQPISKETAKQIGRFKFDKGYQFNMRGYSRGRIGVVYNWYRGMDIFRKISTNKRKILQGYYCRTCLCEKGG